jgi:hypothetical protein
MMPSCTPEPWGDTLHRRATAITAALLLTGLTASCSSESEKPTVSKATDAPPASSSPSPTPSPSQETYKIGDTVDINAVNEFSAAALAYKDKGITGPPGLVQEGNKLAVVEAKVCNKGAKTMSVSPFVWSLAYKDGARVEPFHVSGGELPQPLYPAEAKVKGGDCVRGHILFEAPREGQPERVLYSPDELDEPVEWVVSK